MTAPLSIGIVRSPQLQMRPGWRTGLGRHVTRSREMLLRRLATRIAGVQDRCGRPPATGRVRGRRTTGRGVAQLPARLDRELHLLTMRLSADLHALCRDLSDRALAAALGTRPAGDEAQRVATAVWMACAYRTYETVLVTPAGLATTLRGTRVGTPRQVAGIDPAGSPFEIALAAGCYPLWRERADFHPAEVDAWLRLALDSLAAELLSAVVRRCDRIHAALIRTLGELAGAAA